ncbi:pumilio-family RNA binding repeat containing protein [Babesia ovis]|uniref:Pumilio-family RNA binding repeat containing protein n=1 Tax=Babesia ovis TaxID=5869 RepID=A0A9W5TBV7_BABOV|nr:pumilio-family RNA binding repeat containing protein [Babesia ovis]
MAKRNICIVDNEHKPKVPSGIKAENLITQEKAPNAEKHNAAIKGGRAAMKMVNSKTTYASVCYPPGYLNKISRNNNGETMDIGTSDKVVTDDNIDAVDTKSDGSGMSTKSGDDNVPVENTGATQGDPEQQLVTKAETQLHQLPTIEPYSHNGIPPSLNGIDGTCQQGTQYDGYDQCDSFSTRYADGEDGENRFSSPITLEFNSLSESMLKQLDTPVMEPRLPRCIERDYDQTGDGSVKLNGIDIHLSDNIHQDVLYTVPNSVYNDEGYDLESNYDNYQGSTEDYMDHYRDINLYAETLLARRKAKRYEEFKSCQRYNGYLPINGMMLPEMKGRIPIKLNYGCMSPSYVKTAILSGGVNGNIRIIAKDQTGCRMLQKMLETNDPIVLETILQGVMDNLIELMTDPFGNYLCQKLMTLCSHERLNEMIELAGDTLINVALNMHGTRALQKLIEVIDDPVQIQRLTQILSLAVDRLITDLNGNHVIQKCLSTLSPEDCEFIHQAMIKNCNQFAMQRHGCCVIQRCIDAANEKQKMELVEALTANALQLVEDAFGNYVIQYILKLKILDVNARIVKILAPKVTIYAKQKFSSNVVEKCLILTPPKVRNILVERFVKASYDTLKDLILHPFGNYVIQRVLSVAQPGDLEELLKRIRPHMDELRTISTGKRIAAKITRKHMNNDVCNNAALVNRNNRLTYDYFNKSRMVGLFSNRDNDDLAEELLRLAHREALELSEMDQASDNFLNQSSTSSLATVDSVCDFSQGHANQQYDKFSNTGPSLEMLDALFARTLSIESEHITL